jgi:hypothetical protein
MKKVFFSIMMASVLMACHQNAATTAAATTTTSNAANTPIIKFLNESFDFGKVKQGDKVNYAFKFTNTGKSPLIIKNAVASCGCTIPEWKPKTPILPGEGGVIMVTFNSAGKSGLQDKQITVTANTAPAQSMVHLVGEVLTK